MSQKRNGFVFYTGIGLVSGVVLALQVVQSRIFSVTTWYHLLFLVISMAMFGLTLGAIRVYKMDEETLRREWASRCAAQCFWLAGAIMLSLVVQLYVPLVHSDYHMTMILLPAVALFTALPFYAAGVIVSMSLTRAPFPVGTTYGVDLVGAAAGCLVALGLMQVLDAPTGVVLLALLALLSGRLYLLCADKKEREAVRGLPQRNLWLGMGVFICVALAANLSLPFRPLSVFWVKDSLKPEYKYDYVRWNAISRITVGNEGLNRSIAYWGPSPVAPPEPVMMRILIIDGQAGTPMIKFDGKTWSQLDYLPYDVTNIAYSVLPPGGDVGIIGVGGGRDALSAYYFGAKTVTAIDVNPVQIDLLSTNEKFRDYVHLHDQPGLKLINDEARSWFARNTEKKFDVIQMSMIDTWASTSAGAFALTENGLYTRDALGIFMDDLKPGGVLTVSRWYADNVDSDTQRFLVIALEQLRRAGAKDPAAHIFIATSARISTMVIGKDPLTQEQLLTLRKTAADKQYAILQQPGPVSMNKGIRAIVDADREGKLDEHLASLPVDLSAPTDWRPFFFNQARFRNPLKILTDAAHVGTDAKDFSFGHIRATANLIYITLFSLVAALGVLVWPQRKGIAGVPRAFALASSGYFFLIGLGFMLLEIGLTQIFGLFMGHPIYSLGIILFSLILCTGIGSLLSEKLPASTRARATVWALLTCGVGFALPCAISWMMENMIDAPLLARAGAVLAVILPLGILLGYGFPTGMRFASQVNTRMTPWLWGLNGAAGVLGSALTLVASIAAGIDASLHLGALCYGVLVFPLAIMAAPRAKGA